MKVEVVKFFNGKFGVRRKAWLSSYEFFYYLPTLNEFGWSARRYSQSDFSTQEEAWSTYVNSTDKGTPV